MEDDEKFNEFMKQILCDHMVGCRYDEYEDGFEDVLLSEIKESPKLYLHENKFSGIDDMFDYCPYCGIRIDWGKIKKECELNNRIV